MYFNTKKIVPISFTLLYLILMSIIAYFHFNIFKEHNQDLESTKNKIVGMHYLELLHELSISTLLLNNNTFKHNQIDENIQAIESFLELHPKYNERRLEKHMKFLKTFHTDYSDADFYNFIDFINNENYRAGNKAEILFSKNRERYFQGTLLTHYLPELFISLSISSNILGELLHNSYLDENKKNIYIEHNKLVYLSSLEVHNIISLLPQNNILTPSIEEFSSTLEGLKINKNSLTILKGDTANIKNIFNITHQLIQISEKLNTLNQESLEALFKEDIQYLEDKILKYNFLILFIVVFISAIFIFTLRIIKINQEKDEHIFQQSRLAQMGELISMIAHQWRQPLNVISTIALNMQFTIELEKYDLDTKKGQEEQSKYFLKNITTIGNSIQTLTTTIDDFRNFYKPNKKPSVTNLESVCEKSLSIIKNSLESDGIELVYKYNSQENTNMYANEMMQVFLNIFKNAQDNFVEKKIQNPKITIQIKKHSMRICDNGGGIPEDIRDKIFDPYFSTKDEKNGTGLGLYMSKIIVEKHHKGKISVENTDDGVCFLIDLKKGINHAK